MTGVQTCALPISILGFLADHGGWGVAWLFAAAITLIAGGGMYLGARGGANPRPA